MVPWDGLRLAWLSQEEGSSMKQRGRSHTLYWAEGIGESVCLYMSVCPCGCCCCCCCCCCWETPRLLAGTSDYLSPTSLTHSLFCLLFGVLSLLFSLSLSLSLSYCSVDSTMEMRRLAYLPLPHALYLLLLLLLLKPPFSYQLEFHAGSFSGEFKPS